MKQSKRRIIQSSLVAAAAALFLCLSPAAVRAQVHDNAHVFSGRAVSSADDSIQKMEAKYHKQFVVETFPAVPSDMAGELQSKGKEPFFHDWMVSRAKALGVNGVYTLICTSPDHIETGVDKESVSRGLFTVDDRKGLESGLLKSFTAKNYDGALSDAVSTVERTYGANIPYVSPGQSGSQGQRSTPNNAPYTPPVVAPQSSHGFLRFGLMGTLICLGLGLLIIFGLVKAVFGSRGGNAGGGMFGGGANRGGNYPTGGPTYGQQQGGNMGGGPMMGGGYNAPVQQGGGGFGRGLLGGLLGGAVGGYAADKFEHRNDPAPSSGATSSGGDFGGGGGGGGGGAASGGFDSGPSDAGQGFGDNSSGGDFGGGGGSADTGSSGGDFGGGGGDSGGGGGGDSGSSGGDF